MKNIRRGCSYTVKITMWTDAIKDDDEDFSFNKVEGFVNFETTEDKRCSMLERQVSRKIEFYEKQLQIKVTKYEYDILAILEVDFLPNYPVRKSYEHEV